MTRCERSLLSPWVLLPEPPHLPVYQEAIPMTAPLIAPIQARMGSGGSGAARLGSSPAWIVPSSF